MSGIHDIFLWCLPENGSFFLFICKFPTLRHASIFFIFVHDTSDALTQFEPSSDITGFLFVRSGSFWLGCPCEKLLYHMKICVFSVPDL